MKRVSRGVVRNLTALGVLLAVLASLAPNLLSRPGFFNWVLASTLPLNGKVTVGAVRLGWFSPLHLENVQVTDRQGRPALLLGTLDGDRPLWRMALNRSAPGNFRLTKIQVDAFIDAEGNSLARLVDRERLRQAATLGAELSDVVVVIHKPGAPEWQFGPIQLAADIKADGPPAERELVVRPGPVLKRVAIAAPRSSGLLKYAMPVIADARVSGQISLELDGWRVPLAAPEKATGSGRLVIHHLDVQPGPLAVQLGEALRSSTAIRLAEEAVVPISMAEGRIYHRDLKFTLRNLLLVTRGSVGLDHTLDIVAEVELPREPGKNRPVLGAIQKLSIPIRGTLEQPLIDRTALRDMGKDMIRDAIEGLLRRRLERTNQAP